MKHRITTIAITLLATLGLADAAHAGPVVEAPPPPIVIVPISTIPIGTTGTSGTTGTVGTGGHDTTIYGGRNTTTTTGSTGSVTGTGGSISSGGSGAGGIPPRVLETMRWDEVCKRLGTAHCMVLDMCLHGATLAQIAAHLHRYHQILWTRRRGVSLKIKPTARAVRVALRTRIYNLLQSDYSDYADSARALALRNCQR